MKGSIVSGLAALGLVAGCGGGQLGFSNPTTILGEGGDEGPIGGGDNGTIKDASSEWVMVWKADPLYDADTGAMVGYFAGDKHFTRQVYERMQALCDRYIFLKSIEDGLRNCKGLRDLNYAMQQLCIGNGIPAFKPMLRPLYMKKTVLDLLSYGARYIDLYSAHAKDHLVKALYSFKGESDYEAFMAWNI